MSHAVSTGRVASCMKSGEIFAAASSSVYGVSRPMTSSDDPIPDPVLDQAAAWALRLREAPGDAGVQGGLAAWLEESETHRQAWRLTQKAWHATGQVMPAFAHEWQTPARPRPASPRRRHKAIRYAVLAVAACLVLLVAMPSIRLHLTADHRTDVAEMREVRLQDGSVVTLAPDSAISVALEATRRDVLLLKGEAFFDVEPDRRRPFTVRAGNVAAIVTGTRFDVGLTDRTVSVAVASGSVRVGSVGLVAGQRVTVDRVTGATGRAQVPPDSVALWRDGRLIVENALLTDVVSVIGRSHRGLIVIASHALRERRVTGVYDLRDPAAALDVLVGPYGVVVHKITSYLLVVSAD